MNKGRTKSSSHTTESEPQKAPNKAFCGVNTDPDSQGVLLQTAFVTAMNPQYPSQKVNLRLILDSGSQRSFVCTRVRNMLELPTIKREAIIINTFGTDETDIKTCDVASLGLKSKHSEFYIEIKALEVPTICSPIQGQAVRWAKNQYNYLKGLNLADYPQETKTELEVDLLIGADFIGTLWQMRLSRGNQNKPLLQLGHILVGFSQDQFQISLEACFQVSTWQLPMLWELTVKPLWFWWLSRISR